MQKNDLMELVKAAGAELMVYGPLPEGGGEPIRVAETFGAYEAEYASIRQRVGVLHLPQRGVLELRGGDVKDFLHRLVTQDINGMAGGMTRRSFLLNQRGRIVADLFVHHGDLSTWLESDVFDLPEVASMLDAKLFSEDVTIRDASAERTCVALHGPASVALLKILVDDQEGAQRAADMPGTHHVLKIGDAPVTVARRDTCGVLGLVLLIPIEHAVTIYRALLDAAGFEPDAPDPNEDPGGAADAAMRRRQSLRGRPIGWQAFNTARIEAGSPVFHIDFGPDSLPAEAGPALFDEAVSMNKGCYLGQEIVARMHNLGHPRRVLTGIELPGDHLPVAGTQVCSPKGGAGDIIGGITSSTISVLHGHRAVGFAVLKWGFHEPGRAVLVPVEGEMVEAQTRELRVLSC